MHEKLLATVDEPPNETFVPDSSGDTSMAMDNGQDADVQAQEVDGAHYSGVRQLLLPDTRTPFMMMNQPQNSFLTSKTRCT